MLFFKGSSGTVLLEFKRRPPGQTSCKLWQWPRGGRWGREEENHAVEAIVAITMLVLIWLDNVNNFDKRFKLLASKNLIKISHVLIFQEYGELLDK